MQSNPKLPAWLKLECPECRLPVDNHRLSCPQDHEYRRINGVISLLNSTTREKISSFLQAVESYRAQKQLRPTEPRLFRQLPYGPLASGNFEWRFRQKGWEAVREKVTTRSGMKILEIGAWNGWLSHLLTGAGHKVVALDYFVDPLDGLGAMNHYPVAWTAIQLDMDRLEIIRSGFDLVIFNHCLQFRERPLDTLKSVQRMLLPCGKILILGLLFYANPNKQKRHVETYRADFQKHDFDLFKPTKAYLDFVDREQLLHFGVQLNPYRAFWRANLRAKFDHSRPRYEIGWYPNDRWPAE